MALPDIALATVHLWWDGMGGEGGDNGGFVVRGEFCVYNLNLQNSTLSSTFRCVNLLGGQRYND